MKTLVCSAEQTVVLTGLAEIEFSSLRIPAAPELSNPFNPSTTIRYTLKNDVPVELGHL